MESIYHWFPIKLLIHHIRNNQVLLLSWVILFMITTGNFGKFLGIPYLFLDPEYLNKVNFTSFMLVGASLAGLATAYHITSYIMDGHRFTFVGMVTKPFTTFSINNSILPLTFLITYIYSIVDYQLNSEIMAKATIALNILGLLTGFIVMTVIFYLYFYFTNKDIFIYMVCKLDEKLKQKVPVTRASAMKKLHIAKKEQVRVDSYISLKLKAKRVVDDKGFYNRATILQVFDQNHLNLVVIEFLIFVLLLVLGVFRYNPPFQIPAAASLILFITIIVMFAGAFSFWFGRWSVTAFIALFIIFNIASKEALFSREYHVFGLNYRQERAGYNLPAIRSSNNKELYSQDTSNTLKFLRNWRNKFPEDKPPKMIFTCVSGGGLRAALWTFTVLQTADSLTNGQLLQNTALITGASGGMIGAAYFRELKLRQNNDSSFSPYQKSQRTRLANDNLNSIIFSMVVNDIFIGNVEYEYLGLGYTKDRGYAFEQQLSINTNGLLNKSLGDYTEDELSAKIPMLIMAPTIMNDGRKLFISSQNVSYMGGSPTGNELSGIDFLRFFGDQGSANLKYYSALRMNAAFPYITPNTTLPSEPTIQIMDAGITDNFGINDAVKFLHTFKDWINENTSGVIVLSIRDSQKLFPITENKNTSLIEKFSTPISSIYGNFENLQNLNNESQLEHARSWFGNNIETITIEYNPSLNLGIQDRASLNWRLTGIEKNSITENIKSAKNQLKIHKIKKLLSE